VHKSNQWLTRAESYTIHRSSKTKIIIFNNAIHEQEKKRKVEAKKIVQKSGVKFVCKNWLQEIFIAFFENENGKKMEIMTKFMIGTL
jgi:hypothetical protein